jgi:phosphate transport system permease protein
VTTAVRIAINNLAGVPSIVYGAFGLGFFCYGLGGGIDELFFRASLVADKQPTFGTGGLLWASLTLALLTLPVVIVATEEALSAVPNSMREGSYACGAGKWQTIRRIVLPRALPGIMTGLILAMARGAGEVAPLMLVGVKKLALDLPIDGTFPFVHPEREFMHLAYLIYDVGFQSPNSQAAKPMVFTITFLLVTIIALLNLAAIWIRSRLKRRYVSQQF